MVHAPGRTTHAVSEHAVLLMLALARRLTVLDRAVKRGAWGVREGYEGVELRGKRLGVVGLGAIGRRIAEVGAALGMDVVYWSRTSRDRELRAARIGRTAVDSRCHPDLRRIDTRTRGLIGAEQFARMKPGVLMVNTARAQIIDQTALLAAISAGDVGGYGTDVWEPEPPVADDPLIAARRAS